MINCLDNGVHFTPLMSVPELFYHENLFVGCLSLRRIKRYKAGEILIAAKTNARCLQYVDSQIILVDNKIKQAILRKSAADKQMTKEFRAFKEAYLKFRHQFVASQQNPKFYSRVARSEDWINLVENYLGVTV